MPVDSLCRRDYLLLIAFVTMLSVVPVFDGRLLTTHEAVHCQNVREMLSDHDWLIPHYGGRVWLERPPVPHWLTAVVVAVSGQTQSEWPYRISPALAGLACVLLTAWMTSLWYGRNMALLSGAILATMNEFNHYSVGPECDIFLCLIITIAFALFVRSVFVLQSDTRLSFLGSRPWTVPAFFVVLGLTNTAKGLFFGTIFVLVPVGAYLLLRRGEALRRHIWLWGWLAFLAVAAAWPLVAYIRHPDVVELWGSDYGGRVNQGYMREPLWYYPVHMPINMLPWPIAGIVGAAIVALRLRQDRKGPEVLLLCWALLPIIVFSIPQGKHHHYLLHNLPPWAVMAALGLHRSWQWIQSWPHWLRSPWVATVVVGGAGMAAIVGTWERIPGISVVGPILLVVIPVLVGVTWWAMTNPDPRRAAFVGLGVVALTLGGWRLYQTTFYDNYRPDRALCDRVCQTVPEDASLLVLNDQHPLDSSWVLFYLPERAQLVHNITFLSSEYVPGSTIYVVGRRYDENELRRFGQVELLTESELSRGRRKDDMRWTLYRVTFRQGWERVPGDVHISPMQATGRAPGPHLPMPEQIPPGSL